MQISSPSPNTTAIHASECAINCNKSEPNNNFPEAVVKCDKPSFKSLPVSPSTPLNYDDERPIASLISKSNLQLNGTGYTFEEQLGQEGMIVRDQLLIPCPSCSRTFKQETLERHINICEKINTPKVNTMRKKVASKLATGIPVPVPGKERIKKKKSDELLECPACLRKFCDRAYDRHVAWCEDKAKRLQDSPDKDMVALSKLYARKNYRLPTYGKEHVNKQLGNTSLSRKDSLTSILTDSSMPSLDSFDQYVNPPRQKKTFITRSLGRKGGISCLLDASHLQLTPETLQIRTLTGRGSINRPASNRSAQLRNSCQNDLSKYRRDNDSPISDTRSLSRSVSSSRKSVLKPSVFRPYNNSSTSLLLSHPTSLGRERPEGVEADETWGSYDHSKCDDEKASKQMNELLFGSSKQEDDSYACFGGQPSSNSAFKKYIAPSTQHRVASPMSILSARAQSLSKTNHSINAGWPASKSKAAKFCHQCGNAFIDKTLNFCCECGVKRLFH